MVEQEVSGVADVEARSTVDANVEARMVEQKVSGVADVEARSVARENTLRFVLLLKNNSLRSTERARLVYRSFCTLSAAGTDYSAVVANVEPRSVAREDTLR